MKRSRGIHLILALCVVFPTSACALPMHMRTIQGPVPVPAITKEAAKRALATYQAGKSRADAQRSTVLLHKYEAGSMFAIDAARYRIESFIHANSQAKPVVYVAPRFYIPRLAGYPRWFVVQTARSDDKDAKAIYLVFEESSVVDDGWRVTFAPTSYKGALLPHVMLDDQGYAATLPSGSPVAMPPGNLSTAHANILTRGIKSGDAARFALDRFTASLRKENTTEATELRAVADARYQYRPQNGAIAYTLRSSDGGVLVLYVLESTSTYKTFPKTLLRPLARVQALATGPSFVTHASVTHLDQFVAWVPRSGKVTVLAHEGDLTAAVLG
jgi:hypothetical protein